MNLNDLPQSDNQAPPHSMEAEQAIIGALLQSNDAYDRIADILRPEHFYNFEHRTIFSYAIKLIMSNKAADVITVFDRLQSEGKPGADLAYLNAVCQNTPSAANIRRYADIVVDRAKKRELIALSDEIAGLARSAEDAEKLIDQVTSKVDGLQTTTSSDEPAHITDDLAAFIEDFDARYQGNGVPRLSTGFQDLDAKLNGGLRAGGLYVVAARPKMGKSAFVINIGNHIAQDAPVLLFSLEMPKAEIHERNIASLGKIPMDHVTDPRKMADEDWPRLTHAVQKISASQLFVDVKPGASLMDIRMKSKAIRRKHGLKALIIDYLQLMSGQGDNRNAEIEGITRGLKCLAKELDVPVILLSQLNRELEKRPNKRPKPSDLRDSGSIEQDADVVMFLYRDEVYNPDSQDKGICEVDVALNRQGSPGRVALVYIGEQVRFENYGRPWSPPPPKSPPIRSRGFPDD
jgi:replicative DNA helicase